MISLLNMFYNFLYSFFFKILYNFLEIFFYFPIFGPLGIFSPFSHFWPIGDFYPRFPVWGWAGDGGNFFPAGPGMGISFIPSSGDGPGLGINIRHWAGDGILNPRPIPNPLPSLVHTPAKG